MLLEIVILTFQLWRVIAGHFVTKDEISIEYEELRHHRLDSNPLESSCPTPCL